MVIFVISNKSLSQENVDTLYSEQLTVENIKSHKIFKSCSLKDIEIFNVDLSKKEFINCVFLKSSFINCTQNSSKYILCSIDSMNWQLSSKDSITLFRNDIKNTDFKNCNFSKFNRYSTNFFENCSFKNTNFSNCQFVYSFFVNCKFNNSDLTNTIFYGINFSASDFNSSNMKNTFFQSCTLELCKGMEENQLLSTGSLYESTIEKKLLKKIKTVNKNLLKKKVIASLESDSLSFIDIIVNAYYFSFKSGSQVDLEKVMLNGTNRLTCFIQTNEGYYKQFTGNYYNLILKITKLTKGTFTKPSRFQKTDYEILFWLIPYQIDFIHYLETPF